MDDHKPKDWEDRKLKMMKEHPGLSHEDFEYTIGREEEMLERIQKKINKNKQEIRKWLSLMG